MGNDFARIEAETDTIMFAIVLCISSLYLWNAYTLAHDDFENKHVWQIVINGILGLMILLPLMMNGFPKLLRAWQDPDVKHSPSILEYRAIRDSYKSFES